MSAGGSSQRSRLGALLDHHLDSRATWWYQRMVSAKDGQLPLFPSEPQGASPDVTSAADGSTVPSPKEAIEPPDPEQTEMVALVQKGVAELHAAKGDAARERAAVCRWFKRGAMAGLSTAALVDALGVSAGVLDDAGYSDDEGDRVMDEIVGDISDEEIEQATLD